MINKVYLSGTVAGRIDEISQAGQAKHVVFDLCVPHKTRDGIEKRELYRINAWNGCAKFCAGSLAPGMQVALQGYLSQRTLYVGDRPVVVTEVALNEVTIPAPPEPAISERARRDIEALFAE